MDFRDAAPIFFATDLTNFLACRHLTAVERLAAHKLARRPYFDDPMLELLRQRGLEHERAYVDSLRSGARVVEISRNAPDAFDATLRAMRDGADVVVQAKLEHGRWAGWADVLLRRPGESSFGGWHYEPVETKLAVETRGATLLQLCLYADLLTELQATAPSELHVVTPASTERYRFEEFRAYFRLLRRRFELELQTPLPTSVETATPYPDPVSHCDVCNWYGVCEKRRTADDHLSLVAGIQKTQRTELAQRGIATLAALATMPLPLAWKPNRGSVGALERVREQARLQFQARTSGTPTYELLPVETDHGLAALPVPSSLDVFLDLEGDRQADGGGFEYLFGYAFRGADGAVRYESLWALSPDEEKLAFERFIDMVTGWRAVDWSMHVYHYAPYEPTAMKRLMGRYATRAEELDRLLRAKAFVDLYSVVRKGIRAGVDSYSIKRLEPFYGLVREVDLRVASRHLRALEYALAKKNTGSLTSEIREAVRSYNRDDCVSALQLRDWLETLRVEAETASGESIPRPARPARVKNEKLSERLARIRRIADALTAGLPSERDRTQQARWVLAQLLEWHRREDKVDWWEFHRMNDMSDDELLDERAGIAGLEFERRLETTKRGSVIDRYVFPPQDTDFDDQDDAYELGCEKPSPFAKVDAIDIDRRTLDLRKSGARADQHPRALFKQDKVANPDAVNALMRLGEFVRDHGIDDGGQHRAARDLLLRLNPRLAAGHSLRMAGESTVQSARRAVLALEGGVLAIQGPPGAGKTFTGARMIVDLVRSGRKVGVTAVSHKVIRNLLEEVVRAASEEGTLVRCVHRVSEKSRSATPGIEEETDSARALKRIANREYDVVGGTAWVWAKQDVEEALDVLVVDEAGQMSLANVIACAQAAKNLVLLGDPQQLEQPQKASHPEGSELSALEYLLEGHETMPEDRGLFLGETWRLHPAICSYTSDLFYESKLRSHAGLDAQLVAGPTRFAGAGLFHVAVEHEGNQNTSIEEAATVAEVVTELTMPGVTWTDRHGVARPVTLDEILVVAPYNAQVSEIAERIPGARVGTVDKFQGQEAPIVIYSMATSNPDEAPHGMEFLFSRNRLNVATSRARCVCILVGNPRLFEPECRTPEQMRMANAFSAYLERARVIGSKRTEAASHD
jgi:predicted RecB family nuclease